MIRPVSPTRPLRPLEALRQSSDQIRRAADILAEIADDTADVELPSARSPEATPDEYADQQQATILKAQRSCVAALKLAQVADDQDPR